MQGTFHFYDLRKFNQPRLFAQCDGITCIVSDPVGEYRTEIVPDSDAQRWIESGDWLQSHKFQGSTWEL